MQILRRDILKEVPRLLNSRIIEENDICFLLSLYSYHDSEGKVSFSLYGDYLGFALKNTEDFLEEDKRLSQFCHVISGIRQLTSPRILTCEEYKGKLEELIEMMENITIREILSFIEGV